MIHYIERVGIAVSVLLNVLLGGYSNQTLSARSYEHKKRGQTNLVPLIDKLFWWEPNHCLTSWAYWVVHRNVHLQHETRIIEYGDYIEQTQE